MMMAAIAAIPPATPPTIAPVLLLPPEPDEVGTIIIVERRVVVTTKPSASVDLKECQTRRALIKYMCVHEFRRKYRGQCGRNRWSTRAQGNLIGRDCDDISGSVRVYRLLCSRDRLIRGLLRSRGLLGGLGGLGNNRRTRRSTGQWLRRCRLYDGAWRCRYLDWRGWGRY